jgi:hypothetical protein
MTTTEYTQIPFLLYFLTPRQVGFIPFWGCSAFLLLKLQTLTVRVFLMWLPNQFGSFSQSMRWFYGEEGFSARVIYHVANRVGWQGKSATDGQAENVCEPIILVSYY